jgi:hypothetical protein
VYKSKEQEFKKNMVYRFIGVMRHDPACTLVRSLNTVYVKANY